MSEFYGSGLEQLESEYEFDPRSGYTEIKRWRGAPEKIAEQMAVFALSRTRHSVSEEDEGGHQILRAWFGVTESQPAEQAIADIWSLVGNDLEKPIWTIDKVQAELNKANDPHSLALIKSDIEKLLEGETETVDANGNTQTLSLEYILSGCDSLGIDRTVIRGLINSLAKGVESKSISQFVLRRVLVVASNTSIKPAYDGVNKIWTTENLNTDPSTGGEIPGTILFVLPGGYWLKRTPTVEQQTYDKWQITQEWYHADQYDSFVYDLA